MFCCQEFTDDVPSHPPEADVDGHDVIWLRFQSQTRFEHLVVLLGGVAVWLAVYLYWLHTPGAGQFITADGPAAIAARQTAVTVATTACYVWFSAAFALGKGGPFLDTTIYPIVLTVLGPWVAALVTSTHLGVSMTTGSTVSATIVGDALWMFFPGAFVGTILVGGFVLTIYFVTGTGPEWAARHMPEEWFDVELEHPEE